MNYQVTYHGSSALLLYCLHCRGLWRTRYASLVSARAFVADKVEVTEKRIVQTESHSFTSRLGPKQNFTVTPNAQYLARKMPWKHVFRYREDHTCVIDWTTWGVISLGKGVLWWQFPNLFTILQKFRCLQHCAPRFFMKTISAVSKCYVTWHKCRDRHIFGVRRIFVLISPNLPEKFLSAFYPQLFSHKEHEDLFVMSSPKKVLIVFFSKRRAQTTLGAIFARIFKDLDFQWFYSDFQRFCPNFQGFCSSFRQFKTFGGALALLATSLPASL